MARRARRWNKARRVWTAMMTRWTMDARRASTATRKRRVRMARTPGRAKRVRRAREGQDGEDTREGKEGEEGTSMRDQARQGRGRIEHEPQYSTQMNYQGARP